MYSCIPAGIPAFATTCITCLAGALLLGLAFHARTLEACRTIWRKMLPGILLLAVLNASYNTLYLYGAKSFDVASGAFTFCMTVVVLPVVLLTMRRKISLETWASVVLVFLGIVIALGPSLRGEQLPGLAFMGTGCLVRAIFIVRLADMAKKYDPIAIAVFLQFFAGLFSFGGWFFEEPRLFLALPLSRSLLAAWAIYAYFIVAFAQSLNIFAMKRVTAANATVVYSMEIIFSITWGALLPSGLIENVKLTPSIFVGGLMVVCGSLAEIMDFRRKRSAFETKAGEGEQ